jgi:hypothetical protein
MHIDSMYIVLLQLLLRNLVTVAWQWVETMRGMEHRNWRKQRMKRIMLEREVMVSIEGCVFFTDHTAVMVIKLHEQQGVNISCM